MIIETWIAALFMVLITIIGCIGLLGWMIADQRCKEKDDTIALLQEKNRILEGKLIVKTANEFYNEGKKK